MRTPQRMHCITANDFWIKIFFLPNAMDRFDQTHFSGINFIKMNDGNREQTRYSILLNGNLQLHKVYPTRHITTLTLPYWSRSKEVQGNRKKVPTNLKFTQCSARINTYFWFPTLDNP